MSTRRRALVIGGSMGGLFAATLLARAGWDVDVYERVGVELEGRGAGIVTHEELFDIMRRAGATVDDTVGCATRTRATFERDGTLVAEIPLAQILTAWGRLYRLMKDVFPRTRYHFNKSLVRIEEYKDEVIAHFADGARECADVLIGADGIRSTVRAQFAPDTNPVYVGYLAWRGLADEMAVSESTRRALTDRMSFCLPPGEQMLTYLVAGRDNSTKPGERRFNFVWYRHAAEHTEMRALLTDAHGQFYAQNIPPDRIRPEVIAQMHEIAREVLAPPFVDVVKNTPAPLFQPIYDLESSQIAFGRVALVGDAAFVARPHVGLGVTKAAGDAQALVDALSAQPDHVVAALKAYGKKRVEFGKAIVAHARLLGLGLSASQAKGRQRALITHLRKPEVVMREVAVPDWAKRPIAQRQSHPPLKG